MTDNTSSWNIAPAPEGTVLSVGIVGAGQIVSRVHLPVLKSCEGIRVVYVADVNPKVAKAVADNYHTRACVVKGDANDLPKTDVALLAIPVTERLPYYEIFAQRGTAVLAEKPLASGIQDAERVCRLFPEYALACGFQRRTYASVGVARKLIAESWFGPLRSISIAEGALTTKTGTDSRFYDDAATSSGGVLMDLGCHSLDLAIYLTDATEAVPLEQRFVFDEGIDREIEAKLNLRLAGGSCDVSYLVSWLRPTRNTIDLHFERCIASLSCGPAGDLAIYSANNRSAASLRMENAGASTVYQAFYLEWQAFLQAVHRRQVCELSAHSCLPTVRAVEALYNARTGNL